MTNHRIAGYVLIVSVTVISVAIGFEWNWAAGVVLWFGFVAAAAVNILSKPEDGK